MSENAPREHKGIRGTQQVSGVGCRILLNKGVFTFDISIPEDINKAMKEDILMLPCRSVSLNPDTRKITVILSDSNTRSRLDLARGEGEAGVTEEATGPKERTQERKARPDAQTAKLKNAFLYGMPRIIDFRGELTIDGRDGILTLSMVNIPPLACRVAKACIAKLESNAVAYDPATRELVALLSDYPDKIASIIPVVDKRIAER
jgi:hypothetical protein